MWQPIKFTLQSSWDVSKKLFIIYLFIQTILALTFIIDLLSYKEIIDTISGNKTILGLSLFGVIFVLLIYYLSYKVLEGMSNYIWNLLDSHLAIHLNRKFIDKMATLDLSIFEEPKNVGLANRAFNRFQFQFKYYLKAIVDVYSSFLKLLVSLVIFFYVSPILGGFIVLSNLIHIYINSRQAQGRFLIYRADDEIKRKFEYIVNTLFSKDTLPEIKLYKSFGFFKEKITRIYRQFTGHQLKIEKKHTIYNTLAGFLPTISIFTYSLFIANQVTTGIISAGQFLFLFFN
ncbi:ABC transporter ATP-binding protein, partial [Candidatus Gottesmanbacteria bacterium]|nr:ABC transporter ATP-binding protein [Candidatus Gottesmanbacteria bacterium]